MIPKNNKNITKVHTWNLFKTNSHKLYITEKLHSTSSGLYILSQISELAEGPHDCTHGT